MKLWLSSYLGKYDLVFTDELSGDHISSGLEFERIEDLFYAKDIFEIFLEGLI